MRNFVKFPVGVLIGLLSFAANASMAASPEPKLPSDFYPASAFLLTVSGSNTLQAALDTHHIVRLMPGDYGPGPITLRSGEELYGLPGTKLGKIVIDPGTKGALVSMVQAKTVLFPPSDTVTSGNTILRTYGAIVVQGGALEDNLFVDTRSLNVDVSESGFLRNNRFIRAPGQLQGNATLKFHADPRRRSTGNVFLWVNSGANEGPTTDIVGVPELTIAVVDAELWSFVMKASIALFVTSPMERLNLFAVQGGRYDRDLDVRRSFGLVDSAAKELRVFGLVCGYRAQAPDTDPAKVVLREGNERDLFANCLPYSFKIPSTNTLDVRAFPQKHGTEGAEATGPQAPVVINPTGAQLSRQAALKDMILQTGREMHPWPGPTFEQPPDPAGNDWAKDAAAAPDSTQALQARLDKEAMVVLPAGKYYISAPLRLNRDKGLIGAGMGGTAIIAKDPNMSMFIFDAQGKTRGLTLANLTVEGGAVGVHLRDVDVVSGPVAYTCISHITFRNLSKAGVFLDMPGPNDTSLDNNMISFCNFVNCGSGLKQTTPNNARWGFIDKLVTYRCQFLGCGLGVDFPAGRTDNTNTFIECLFKGNTAGAVRLLHNATPVFANCDFIDNAGDPVVASDAQVDFLSCRFHAGGGAASLLPSQSCSEGCVFEPGEGKSATVVHAPSKNHFYNCEVKMEPGPLKDGLLLNNVFADHADMSQVGAYMAGGNLSVIVPGVPKPGPQFLVTGPRPEASGN